MGGGLAALSITRTSKFRARAQMFADRAARRAGLVRSGGLWSFVKNTVAKEYNLHKQNVALFKATPTAWSRGVDRLPGWAKSTLVKKVADVPLLRERLWSALSSRLGVSGMTSRRARTQCNRRCPG